MAIKNDLQQRFWFRKTFDLYWMHFSSRLVNVKFMDNWKLQTNYDKISKKGHNKYMCINILI